MTENALSCRDTGVDIKTADQLTGHVNPFVVRPSQPVFETGFGGYDDPFAGGQKRRIPFGVSGADHTSMSGFFAAAITDHVNVSPRLHGDIIRCRETSALALLPTRQP